MKFKILITILLIFILGACGNDHFEPAKINVNVDSCFTCSMGIQDEQASAQTIDTDGTPNKFDDIGCMMTYFQENKDQIKIGYVHDHDTKEWIELDTAFFVQSSENVTPMSYGLIAFSSESAAKEWQEKNGGDLYSTDQLLQQDVKSFKKNMNESHHH
ncbi:nitrous oxide reductase accessory protein NosL [Bacillus sp. REN16]|uniref:nitrous oxide reductase accessory protein NosL n=1 Tax=Bacillus sp. REN16 TaxID=2887296 RepID=UPI001E45CFC7|nr:nitrous oxide reductase accessory protein NosL [Bacillus sp. REN16]MCC3358023.1 nitrous oxide reductase accessory protein NosL [Bacillus sp. REN16]